MLIFFQNEKKIIYNEMEYLFLFSLQLVNNLWNEKELIIQKVFIVEKCILVAPIIAENGGYKTAS